MKKYNVCLKSDNQPINDYPCSYEEALQIIKTAEELNIEVTVEDAV